MGLVAKISPDFKIDIPEELRQQPGWKPGQEVAFLPSEKGFTIVPVATFDDLFGTARGANTEGYRDRNDRY